MRNAIFLAVPCLLLLAACGGTGNGVSLEEWDEEDATEQVEVAMPRGGEVVDERHGEEQWFAIGAVSGVKNMSANGVAQAHYFADGTYLHNLKVNIARAEDGFFYEGWVMGPQSEDWVSLGHLHSNFGDARHGVQFRADRDLREHLTVRVTKEWDDGNPEPGLVVAEGALRVTER